MFIIAGDWNGQLKRFPVFDEMVVAGEIIDIGAVASIWGGIDCKRTCQVSHKARATRPYYILVSKSLMPVVSGFRVWNPMIFQHASLYRLD